MPIERAHPSVPSVMAQSKDIGEGKRVLFEENPELERMTSSDSLMIGHKLLIEMFILQHEHFQDENLKELIGQCLQDYTNTWKGYGDASIIVQARLTMARTRPRIARLSSVRLGGLFQLCARRVMPGVRRRRGVGLMYQLEVKRWLVFHNFPVADGWDVTIDIDAMERGQKGQHPPDKREIAAECEDWLRAQGVRIVAHPLYGRADLVAAKESEGTFVVEVEGDSSRQKEQAMYSALGQIVLSMGSPSRQIAYALAVLDSEKWERQIRKVPARIRSLLRLHLWLVSQAGVRSV